MAKLISITKPVFLIAGKEPTPEELIVYCARVSSPQNQENLETAAKLLKYCINQGHWSIFEQVGFGVEVTTSRAISAQIIRHQFKVQEFSQRYAEVLSFQTYEARRQDVKNRQNSIDDLSNETKAWFLYAQARIQGLAKQLYQEALDRHIAKESARFLLPMSATTTLYLSNTVRGWIHFLQVRSDPSTQKEHQDIALEIKAIFKDLFPNIYQAVFDE